MPHFSFRSAIPLFVLAGLIIAGLLWMNDMGGTADVILFWTLIIGALPLAWDIAVSMIRGHFGVDLIAIVAIGASLIFGQYLAGTVILLMLSGGEALEAFALRRARKELTHLINNAPTVAHKEVNGSVIDVPAESVNPGDIILVKSGETIPVDGIVTDGNAMVDEAALTGEAMPQQKQMGSSVMSGSIAKDGVLHVKATKASHESKYQQIIRLVQEAEEHKAPFVRLADRYSVWFTSLAFGLAAIAWFISKDPVRMLAVLVVATPCPLILATPIAFASGISKAAKRGIIVRDGGALERLGGAKCFVFDKTGTLTLGAPVVEEVRAFGTTDQATVLRLAASLDQLSTHVLARSLTSYAGAQKTALVLPEKFAEQMGDGVSGVIDGKKYFFGRMEFLHSHGVTIGKDAEEDHVLIREEGGISVLLGDEKTVLGSIHFTDSVRPDVGALFKHIKELGIKKVLMLTGDKKETAYRVANEIGLDEADVRAECLPEQKVSEVQKLRAQCGSVVMVGDGVNDAPALTEADVGIAMGGHGSTASSEAGDIVILIDRIERVGEALFIGHRVLAIALQSILIGIGLSTVLMVIAAAGYINPVAGALLQEIIDVVVIFNALRVLLVRTEEKIAA